MKFDTKVVRGSSKPDPTTGSIVPPLHQTATYVLEEVDKMKGYDYTRSANPTREVLENKGGNSTEERFHKGNHFS